MNNPPWSDQMSKSKNKRQRLDDIAYILRTLWSAVDEDDLPDLHPMECKETCIAEIKRLLGVVARVDASDAERNDAGSQAARLMYAHKFALVDVASGEGATIDDAE
jgi:hypothetical protein